MFTRQYERYLIPQVSTQIEPFWIPKEVVPKKKKKEKNAFAVLFYCNCILLCQLQ